MQRTLLSKAALIFVLMLLLLIPLMFIKNAISERATRRDQVQQEIAGKTSARQTVAGPLIVLPYKLSKTVLEKDKDGRLSTRIQETLETAYLYPKKLEIKGQVQTETRKRGIFEALLYQSDLDFAGEFQVSPHAGIKTTPDARIEWLTPSVVVGLSDNRGIVNAPEIRLGNQTLTFAPGQGVRGLGNGIHADIKLPVAEGGSLPFSFKLKLRGTRWLGWLPMGEDTKVSITSPWPHPSFGGHMLPASREVSESGFTAHWQASHLATNLPQHLSQILAQESGNKSTAASHVEQLASGITFTQPVDIYQQTERSAKYGFLFVMLTFAVFALFEVLKSLPIHPVQYGLVGIALALFFLLLLALSEHLSFRISYLIAALSCVGLIGFYLSSVLHSKLRSLIFSGWLALLYAALYGLLVSEDNALLMGSMLLFLLLACAMAITRKVDWYGLGKVQNTVQS
ncbi:inner membrane protein [Formivibrio citricus]|uniref:Inner membrane protein n=1 Tax=Formivibrio citricus TaxID=83765 RepID=A0A1I5BMU8_9NEIS|nr:cell envelope integrity protein CreD [Formivibrio citricus]SFN75801.1 inner membrane protein [Formivibrio citricus]